MYRQFVCPLPLHKVKIEDKITIHKMSKEKKTILFTIDAFHISGVTTFIQQYSKILKKNNFNIIVLGLAGDVENLDELFPYSTNIAIPQQRKHSLIGRVQNFYTYLKYLHLTLKNNPNITTVHLSTVWSSLHALAHPYVWKKRKIMTFYGAFDLESRSMNKYSSKKLVLQKIAHHLCLAQVDHIITFSKYAKKLIYTHFSANLKKKITIIPGFYNSESKKIKKITSNNKKEIILVNFGRAEHRKGLILLLEATKKLINKGYQVKTLVASPVDFYQINSELIAKYESLNLLESVHFLHRVDTEQKKALLRKATLFIMPSLDLETFGLTILESLSHGVAVIGTPAGAIPETLSKISSKLIAESVDSDALVKSIEWYINLPLTQKKQLQNKAYTVLNKEFSPEKYEKKLLRLYSK